MKIYIFGDSTTQSYGEKQYPQQGWAHYILDAFKVEAVNFGHAGYSLKTFIYSPDYQAGKTTENEPEKSEWAKILSNVQEGDYMIMYWAGINDMLQACNDQYRKSDSGEYVRDWQNLSKEVYIPVGKGLGDYTFYTLTSTVQESIDILSDMVEAVKAKGGIPLLVRGTGKYYKVKGNDKNVISVVRRYSEAVEEVAKRTNTEFIDVGTEFEKEFKKIGYDKMLEKYFDSIQSYRNYSKLGNVIKPEPKVDDNVHYNIEGAKLAAKIFVEKLRQSGSDLKNYLK